MEITPPVQANGSTAVPRLRRVLTLWDLVFYGMVLIMPIAPVPLFGVVQERSHGYLVDTILIALLAMMITAFSYGRMAALYPSAGSAYTYVGRGLNLHLGFLVGWAMILDYLLIPLINAVWVAETIHGWVHQIPTYALMAGFVGVITFMNLRGIRMSALANKLLLAVMCVVIVAFAILAVHYLFHLGRWGGIFSSLPFYDPKTFDCGVIRRAVPLAALTYIGFDGVTTLAEDVKNPKRNVLLATVLVCLLTGVLGSIESYLAQRVWPGFHFENVTGAYMDICLRVGGRGLFLAMTAVTILRGGRQCPYREPGGRPIAFRHGTRQRSSVRGFWALASETQHAELQHLDYCDRRLRGRHASCRPWAWLRERSGVAEFRCVHRLYCGQFRSLLGIRRQTHGGRSDPLPRGCSSSAVRIYILWLDLAQPEYRGQNRRRRLACRRSHLLGL